MGRINCSSWGDGNILYFESSVITLLYAFVKSHPSIHSKCENFNVWKVDLGKIDFFLIQEKGQH